MYVLCLSPDKTESINSHFLAKLAFVQFYKEDF